MYISDTNYAEAIANLEDCMFALKSMHLQTEEKGYATKEDIAYVEPRFEEALSIILQLNKHPVHQKEFYLYIMDQKIAGTTIYEALGSPLPYGSIITHLGNFLADIVEIQKRED